LFVAKRLWQIKMPLKKCHNFVAKKLWQNKMPQENCHNCD